MFIINWRHWTLEELPDNGLLFAGGCDQQLDDNNWGLFAIILKDGVVRETIRLTHSECTDYDVGTELIGKNKEEIIEWLKYEEHTSGYEYCNRLGDLMASSWNSHGTEPLYNNVTNRSEPADHLTQYELRSGSFVEHEDPRVRDNGDGTASFTPGTKLVGMGF